MPSTISPFYPVIYLRGFAATIKEINETTADPFNGFNVGSTLEREGPDEKKYKFIFESPVIRLASEYSYKGAFVEGREVRDESWKGNITNRSIIIFRYYDDVSNIYDNPDENLFNKLFHSFQRHPIKYYAKELGKLIEKVRENVCKNIGLAEDDFRCYLVAHSMGGLICRAFLHSDDEVARNTKKCVDKVFTYGTPHNGIDGLWGNSPSINLLGVQAKDFNRKSMAEYLNVMTLYETNVREARGRVNWLISEHFPAERFFCLVGTNHIDYEVLGGIPRALIGRNGSDGLVKKQNALLFGVKADGSNIKTPVSCPNAHIYRSHSGNFGLVNSEEAYRNLTGFLFGKVKVDIGVDINSASPPSLSSGRGGNGGGGGNPDEGSGRFFDPLDTGFDALYKFEIQASVRGQLGFLTRRLESEDSAESVTYKEIRNSISEYGKKTIHLSTIFLGSHNPNEISKTTDFERSRRKDVGFTGETLSFSVTIGVPIPIYELNNTLFHEDHFEGTYLFRDTLIVEITQRRTGSTLWDVLYRLQSESEKTTRTFSGEKLTITIPMDGKSINNLEGPSEMNFTLWLNLSQWNNDDDSSLSGFALTPRLDGPIGPSYDTGLGLSQPTSGAIE